MASLFYDVFNIVRPYLQAKMVEYLLDKRDWTWSTIHRTRYSEAFTRPIEPCSAFDLDPKVSVSIVPSGDDLTVTACFYLPRYDLEIKIIAPRHEFETRKLGRTSRLVVYGTAETASVVPHSVEYFALWNIHDVVHAFVTAHPKARRDFWAIGIGRLIKTYIGTTHYADFEAEEKNITEALETEIFPWLDLLSGSTRPDGVYPEGFTAPATPLMCNLKPIFKLCKLSNGVGVNPPVSAEVAPPFSTRRLVEPSDEQPRKKRRINPEVDWLGAGTGGSGS